MLDQIVQLETQLSELTLKRVDYDRLYTREHPTYRTLMSQMNELQAQKAQLLKKVDACP